MRSRAARFATRSTWRRSISTSCPRSIATCGCSRTNRRNLFALHDRDYANAAADLARRARAARRARPARTRAHAPRHEPRASLGYVFNPVSFFLDYDADRRADVGDRRGQQHLRRSPRYVLGPAQRIARCGAGASASAPTRELFVSPFLHGDRDLRVLVRRTARRRRRSRSRCTSTRRDGDRMFVAHLAGTRRALTDRALARGRAALPADDRCR